VCYLRAGQLIAMDSVNRIQDHMQARKLIEENVWVDKERLIDINRKLVDCVQ
jgi:hypothetical protein